MNLYYAVMLVLSVGYYLVACFYSYRMLTKLGVKMNFYLVTTPGYLYFVARNTNRNLRMLTLSSVCAFLLVLVATGMLEG
ncbi:MAG: hypothetical protein HRU06_16400 [Oceanospirillaceae bacterium]|nr:hypothetical protein [Oceanospirillaceae bacterium]